MGASPPGKAFSGHVKRQNSQARKKKFLVFGCAHSFRTTTSAAARQVVTFLCYQVVPNSWYARCKKQSSTFLRLGGSPPLLPRCYALIRVVPYARSNALRVCAARSDSDRKICSQMCAATTKTTYYAAIPLGKSMRDRHNQRDLSEGLKSMRVPENQSVLPFAC